MEDQANKKHLGVIIKLVERCNIDCTYCYVFNMNDKSYLKHPIYIPQSVVKQIISFLEQAIKELAITDLTVEFHGGEPLMLNKERFDQCCESIKSALSPHAKLNFALQTNAMLIDEEWIELFHKYRIGLGISIDGPKEYHDKYRIDKLGRGTYERVCNKIHMLHASNKIPGFGALCVINPEHSGKRIYRHFADELGLKSVDFILPFSTHDETDIHTAEEYGRYLCEIFSEWSREKTEKVKVRFLRSVLSMFLGGNSYIYGIGKPSHQSLPLISIASNGDLSPTDEFKSIDNTFVEMGCNVKNTTLKQFYNHSLFSELKIAQNNLSTECQSCYWQNVCQGGSLLNRFSKTNRFANPSRYCNGLKMLYVEVTQYLLKNGYSIDELCGLLNLETVEA